MCAERTGAGIRRHSPRGGQVVDRFDKTDPEGDEGQISPERAVGDDSWKTHTILLLSNCLFVKSLATGGACIRTFKP